MNVVTESEIEQIALAIIHDALLPKLMNGEIEIMNNRENVLRNKSYTCALKIISAYKRISEIKKEYVLSKQLLMSRMDSDLQKFIRVYKTL